MVFITAKVTKRVKRKTVAVDEPIRSNETNSDQKLTNNSRRKLNLKKKKIVKSKPAEKPGLKLKKTVDTEKKIDERVIDVNFEEKLPTLESIKPEAIRERDERINYLTGIGTQHPVHEMIQKFRSKLLNSGFNELENSFFMANKDILRQYHIKSSLAFDKVYCLAENKQETFELSEEQIQQLQNMRPSLNIDIEKLIEIINEYNEYKIEFYQIFDKLKKESHLTTNDINRLLDEIPQLKDFNPKVTNLMLRSNMASSWLTTLVAIMDKENLPIKVFSTGVWFKREPKLNELNLRSYYGASCIIMNDKITVNNGKIITGEILNTLDFKDLEFRESENNQNLNINVKEQEVFVNNIKIATCGLFSKKLLRKYGIDIPVLYINFGLERMVMVQNGIDDIRELMYPQFYKAWKLNDQEIGKAIQFIKMPETDLGKKIATNIIQVCEKNYNVNSPCEFLIWEDPVTIKSLPKKNGQQFEGIGPVEKQLTIKVIEREKDSKLCGPAFLNEIVVRDGDVYGIQNPDQNQELAEAYKTNIRYLDAFSKLVGRTVETKLSESVGDNETFEIGLSIIKDMEDINLQLDGRAFRYLLTNNKKIDVRGPMFLTIECQLGETNIQAAQKSSENEKSVVKDGGAPVERVINGNKSISNFSKVVT